MGHFPLWLNKTIVVLGNIQINRGTCQWNIRPVFFFIMNLIPLNICCVLPSGEMLPIKAFSHAGLQRYNQLLQEEVRQQVIASLRVGRQLNYFWVQHSLSFTDGTESKERRGLLKNNNWSVSVMEFCRPFNFPYSLDLPTILTIWGKSFLVENFYGGRSLLPFLCSTAAKGRKNDLHLAI